MERNQRQEVAGVAPKGESMHKCNLLYIETGTTPALLNIAMVKHYSIFLRSLGRRKDGKTKSDTN